MRLGFVVSRAFFASLNVFDFEAEAEAGGATGSVVAYAVDGSEFGIGVDGVGCSSLEDTGFSKSLAGASCVDIGVSIGWLDLEDMSGDFEIDSSGSTTWIGIRRRLGGATIRVEAWFDESSAPTVALCSFHQSCAGNSKLATYSMLFKLFLFDHLFDFLQLLFNSFILRLNSEALCEIWFQSTP